MHTCQTIQVSIKFYNKQYKLELFDMYAFTITFLQLIFIFRFDLKLLSGLQYFGLNHSRSDSCSYVRDATASMAVAFSLFNFPAKRPTIFDEDDESEENKGINC